MTFYRQSVVLGDNDLARIVATVRAGGYGLVLIASWQAVIRGLVQDENDNAAAVSVVERVKGATRQTGIPWLIDAHSGKIEDQDDEADPSRAMRGASAAAGAADYTLWLRYADGAFGTKRRLSGRGRFVTLAPLLIDYDMSTGAYTALGTTKSAVAETDWRLIMETPGALTIDAQSADSIARALGLVAPKSGKVAGGGRKRVLAALRAHPGEVEETTVTRENGQRVSRFQLRAAEAATR
jgi:hypothetical protein